MQMLGIGPLELCPITDEIAPRFHAEVPIRSFPPAPSSLLSRARCAILVPRKKPQQMSPAMPPSSRSAMELEFTKLAPPRIFLVRMLVFLVLCTLIMVVLYKQIIAAFFANPGLNALIGIVLSFRQVIRLYPEVAWVNNFRIADPGLAMARHPTLLAPMAAILGGERSGRI